MAKKLLETKKPEGVTPLIEEEVVAHKMRNSTEINPSFSGVAISVVCVKNQGFNNFQVLTLHIEKGKIVKMDRSDMWANFETIAMLDHICHLSMIHLNNNFEDGKPWQF